MPYRKEYMKQYYLDNKERILWATKQYRENNCETISEKAKQHYIDNREKKLKQNKKYYGNNREKKKEYYHKNIEKILEQRKQWRRDNPEKMKKNNIEYSKSHKEEIREQQRAYLYNRRKVDLKYNLGKKISRAISHSLKEGKNGRTWTLLVNYTCDDLIERLKNTMPKGYAWQDFLEGRLHIDHIIPISVFNYTKPEHEDFKRCWAMSNLRLLPAKENISKSDKLYKPFQPTFQWV